MVTLIFYVKIWLGDDMKVCKVHNCNNKIEAKGFCQKHYKRYKQGQNPFIDSKKDKNRYYIDGNKIVIVTRGSKTRNVIVDLDMKDIVKEILKENVITGNKSYPQITIYNEPTKTSILLSYKLFGEPTEGFIYTYKDSDGYNLTKANVELISTIEQARLMSVKNAKYLVPGLSYNKNSKKWIVTISHEGKSKYLGSFDSEFEGAKARIIAERHYWGKEYSKLD